MSNKSNNEWTYQKKKNKNNTKNTKSNISYNNPVNQKEYSQYEKNKKTILCINILTNGSCGYNDKCLYAHSYSEQKIEPTRKYIYDILNNTNKLDIDLSVDNKLLKAMTVFTKVCRECEKNNCSGGYNCKYGAINSNYQICYKDLYYGVCENQNCKFIHLTSRGVKSANTINNKTQISKPLIETSIANILNDDCDSDSDISIDKIENYLNTNDDTDPCDKSIFTNN